jgi:hypothetical protein
LFLIAQYLLFILWILPRASITHCTAIANLDKPFTDKDRLVGILMSTPRRSTRSSRAKKQANAAPPAENSGKTAEIEIVIQKRNTPTVEIPVSKRRPNTVRARIADLAREYWPTETKNVNGQQSYLDDEDEDDTIDNDIEMGNVQDELQYKKPFDPALVEYIYDRYILGSHFSERTLEDLEYNLYLEQVSSSMHIA